MKCALLAAVVAAAIGWANFELSHEPFTYDRDAALAAFRVDVLDTVHPGVSTPTFGRWNVSIPAAFADPVALRDRLQRFRRLKRWHYISLSTERYFVAFAIANVRS